MKLILPNALVNTSANCKWVGIYEGVIRPTCIFSQIMWQSISMRFFHSWNTRLAATYNAIWLSQNRGVAEDWVTLRSCKMYYNQVNSKQVFVMAQYSDSADDLETFVCFFDFHEIRESQENAIPCNWSACGIATCSIWIIEGLESKIVCGRKK